MYVKCPGLVVGQDTRYPYGQNPGVGLHGPGQPHNPSVIVDPPTNQPGFYVSSSGDHVNKVPGDHVNKVPGDHGPDHHHEVQLGGYTHNVPPAPEPSISSYIATLSYGEGYPTIVYHCSLTDHKPVTTTVVLGPNGHICTVSYYRTPSHALAPPLNDVHHHQPNKGPFTTFLEMILPTYEKKSAGNGNPVDTPLIPS